MRNDTQVVHYNRQGPSGSVKQDQNNFAVPDPNQPPVYQAFEGKPRAKPAQHPKDPIHTVHENSACLYDPSEGQLQNSKKKQRPIQRNSKSCDYSSQL